MRGAASDGFFELALGFFAADFDAGGRAEGEHGEGDAGFAEVSCSRASSGPPTMPKVSMRASGTRSAAKPYYALASDVLIDYYQPISKHWSFKNPVVGAGTGAEA